MAKSFVLAGGGTAGHVNPMLATAEVLRERGHRVTIVGTAEGLEADLVPRAGFELRTIARAPFPRRPGGYALRFPRLYLGAVAAARRVLDDSRPDAVVGFGGYVSPPVYRAARGRAPVVVHEANARPGLANRLGARRAARVCVAFPGTPLPRAEVTGMPFSRAIEALAGAMRDPLEREAARDRARARLALGWPGDAPGLLVTGGSLGAAAINDAVAEAIGALVGRGAYVVHLTGRGKSGPAEGARAELPAGLKDHYVVREYEHDIASLFAAADAVVCRAGSATVSEVTALALPALYVPLGIGNGEQALNARAAVAAGAAVTIDNDRLTGAALELGVEPLLHDPERREQMVEAATGLGIVDGAARLADVIEEASA